MQASAAKLEQTRPVEKKRVTLGPHGLLVWARSCIFREAARIVILQSTIFDGL